MNLVLVFSSGASKKGINDFVIQLDSLLQFCLSSKSLEWVYSIKIVSHFGHREEQKVVFLEIPRDS